MPDKNSKNDLPTSAEIISAYEKLFSATRRGVRRFKQSGLRYIEFSDGIILVEQNPNKDSQWAELASKGHQIAWLMRAGEYLARVMDGEIEILHG